MLLNIQKAEHSQQMEEKSDVDVQMEDLSNEDQDRCNVERRIVRKLDMTLMPMVWIVYLIAYMDRNNLA